MRQLTRGLKAITVSAAVLVLVGCATLSKQECLVADWQGIGYSDGASGYSGERLSSHNKACAKANVTPDYQAWMRGRKEGLKQYCTEARAYQLGKNNQQLNAVCPASTTSRLQRINAEGREVYSLSRQVTAEQEQLEQYQQEYKSLREGENLGFSTEKEARTYLISLPSKVRISQQRIAKAKERLIELQRAHSY